MVGNEVLLRGDLTRADLFAHLDHVRGATRQPVSTAEPRHVWMLYPELAEHVDYIAVHMLPYWEGIEVEAAVEHVVDKDGAARADLPRQGRSSSARWAGPAPAARANRPSPAPRTRPCSCGVSCDRAQQEGYVYYVMEAFDQPWKERSEGKVGAYWGVYDADRQQKFAFTEPIVRIPHWQCLQPRR